MNKKVYVANLPFQANEPELKVLFSKAGDVMSIKIVSDRQTGQPKGIVFVEMSTQWEARRAVSMLNRTDFMGETCWSKRRSSGAATGGDSHKKIKPVIRMERSHYE